MTVITTFTVNGRKGSPRWRSFANVIQTNLLLIQSRFRGTRYYALKCKSTKLNKKFMVNQECPTFRQCSAHMSTWACKHNTTFLVSAATRSAPLYRTKMQIRESLHIIWREDPKRLRKMKQTAQIISQSRYLLKKKRREFAMAILNQQFCDKLVEVY